MKFTSICARNWETACIKWHARHSFKASAQGWCHLLDENLWWTSICQAFVTYCSDCSGHLQAIRNPSNEERTIAKRISAFKVSCKTRAHNVGSTQQRLRRKIYFKSNSGLSGSKSLHHISQCKVSIPHLIARHWHRLDIPDVLCRLIDGAVRWVLATACCVQDASLCPLILISIHLQHATQAFIAMAGNLKSECFMMKTKTVKNTCV